MHPQSTAWVVSGMLALAPAAAEPTLIARWSFDGAAPGENSVAGAPSGQIERAQQVEGHDGKALAFEDWSLKNYLKPDPKLASRVLVDHDPRLNPAFPFKVSAWIYPTADPIYYGGIVEKGRGFGASYRLLLLRGLKVEASLGGKHITVRSQSPISLNAWHDVTLIADGRALTLLVDGKEAGRAAAEPAEKLASADPLVIGDRFTGRIDEVTISRE